MISSVLDYDSGIFTGQYWISKARVIKNAVYRQEWVDPKDGKSVLTNSPLAHYTPATCEFDSGDILSAPFSLTQKGHLPLFVYKELVVTGYCSVVVSFH